MTLERKTTEARIRYMSSMGLSAHFDPVAQAPPALERRRSRQSFFMGASRVDPSSFIRTSEGVLHRTASSLARERVFKTNFEGGVMNPSEESSTRNRRVSLIDPPKAPAGQEEIRFRAGKKTVKNGELGDGAISVGSLCAASGSVNNTSLTMNSLISPGRAARAGTNSRSIASPPEKLKTHIKVRPEINNATNMDTSNIVPARKQSRWSRKKSLEAGKAAFLAMTSPKKYGFNKPQHEPTPTIGHGTAPTTHHRRNFSMVVCPKQAVLPPWATS